MLNILWPVGWKNNLWAFYCQKNKRMHDNEDHLPMATFTNGFKLSWIIHSLLTWRQKDSRDKNDLIRLDHTSVIVPWDIPLFVPQRAHSGSWQECFMGFNRKLSLVMLLEHLCCGTRFQWSSRYLTNCSQGLCVFSGTNLHLLTPVVLFSFFFFYTIHREHVSNTHTHTLAHTLVFICVGGEFWKSGNVCDIMGMRCVSGPCRTLR